MALVTLKDIEKSFGPRRLLRGVSLVVGEGDRVGLVGPNGSGKSTLLKIVAGLEPPDGGERTTRRDLRLGYLEQEPAFPPHLTVRDVVRRGLRERAALLEALDAVHAELARSGESAGPLLRRQAELEDRLALAGGHDVEHRVESLIHSFGLEEPDARCERLSGGELRRAALARLLLGAPDLLLLDEPTNHLDALVTDWLEDYLLESRTPLLMVTHDRYFLDRVVDRIVEIDRGALHGYEGGYADFLVARADRIDAERRAEESRANLLRRETKWMLRGPPGRGTKAKARIRRYERLIEAAPDAGPARLVYEIPPGPRLGTKVLRLRGVGQWSLLRDLDLTVEAGERIGIVGRNGAGKTTLLRICMGLLAPERGRVETGSTVRFAHIDQTRADLDPDKSVARTLDAGPSLAAAFFPGELHETPVRELSGGERNRLLLAGLLLQGGNVLVLDEPTNDLDLTTLRVLEEALLAFPGTVLVVSHDRYFLDRVATRILYLDGEGNTRLHPGDMSGLIESMKARPAAPKRPKAKRSPRRKGLSYMEKRELEELPERIARAESELAELDARLADPAVYARPDVRELLDRRKRAAESVEALYARWERLESLDS